MDERARRTVSAVCAIGGIILAVIASLLARGSGVLDTLALAMRVLGIGALVQAVLIRLGLYTPRGSVVDDRDQPRSQR